MEHNAHQTQSGPELAFTARLFGGFELHLDGVSAPGLRAHKDRWLLALLLLAHGKPLERGLLAVTLWPFPDFDAGRASANLRRGLCTLRQALGPQVWRLHSPTPDTIAFDITDAWVDLVEFDRAIASGDHASLERAITLHRAPLLQVCTESWIEPEREQRQQHRRRAREALLIAAPDPAETALASTAVVREQQPEPEGGAVPLDSSFYIVRPADAVFETAIARRDSIVLIKGARESGKTSLLARGLQQARESGAQVILTDFQTLTAEQLASAETLFLTLAEAITDQLQLDVVLEESWNPKRGWNVNFEKFLRRDVLGKRDTPLVWALDEIDLLFGRPFSSDVFGLFRSWHNQRALNPSGHWGMFTLAIAYATEAHLFISDLNQSPFNVGTRLALEDFTRTQAAELNDRCGAPLHDAQEVERFYTLVGGYPALVRRGLQEMTARHLDIATLEAEAQQEDGVFGNHLHRMLQALQQDPALHDAMRQLLHRQASPPDESFYRLRSAGLLVGKSAAEARPRCLLYQQYLQRHLT